MKMPQNEYELEKSKKMTRRKMIGEKPVTVLEQRPVRRGLEEPSAASGPHS